MLHLQVTKTTMELLPLVCVSLLTWSGTTFADENEPNVIKVTVEEGSDAILPCSLTSTESIEFKLFDWKKDDQKQVFFYDAGMHSNKGHTGQDKQFIGRVSHFEDELKSGNASIIIKHTTVADSGNYTCEFPQLQPKRQIFHIKLHVGGILKDRTAENIPGAAPEPYITTLNETKDGVPLRCVVRGAFPKPEVEWKDSDGIKLSAEKTQDSESNGRYDIILQTTVNKAGSFRCVATQKEISHTTYAETYVPIRGDTTAENNPGSSTGLVVTIVVLCVVVVVLLGIEARRMCYRST